jgi:hypothetical protein
MSDDLNRGFFNGDVELNRYLTEKTGKCVTRSKGTIQLLEEGIGIKVRPTDAEPMKETFARLRAVRKMRQIQCTK